MGIELKAWAQNRTQKLTEISRFFSLSSFIKTRSQLIKAGVKLLIQNKRKNSGSSSCDADYRPPPSKIRATSVSSPVPRNHIVIPEVPLILTSPKDEESSFDNFQIKTDDTSSCDEDSDSKFSAGKQQVIKNN